jgi:LysM repeat protein
MVNDAKADSTNTNPEFGSELWDTAGATSRSVVESIEHGARGLLERGDAPEWDSPKAPASTREITGEPTALIAEITGLVNAKPARIIAARDKLNEMLSTPLTRQQSAFVKSEFSNLAEKWLFNRTVLPNDMLCSNYKVEPGGRLANIGREFKVPYQILMRINNIERPETLRAEETIKVINGPFHVKICRSAFTMDLYLQDTFVRSFSVGLGAAGRETPTGLWRVKPGGKLVSPIWTDPDTGIIYRGTDSDYPLGSRWIGLQGLKGAAEGRTGFAIHGTNSSGQTGQAISRGCIRMNDNDVKLVYDLLTPGLSQVVVVE